MGKLLTSWKICEVTRLMMLTPVLPAVSPTSVTLATSLPTGGRAALH